MKRKTGTRQWAQNNANCIKGCLNACRYCYGRKNAVRFKQCTPEEWSVMKPNPLAAKKIRKYPGRVMFPTTHDLHIEHKDWWVPFLHGMLDAGNDMLIVSKPQVAAIDYIIHNLKDYKDQIEFRFTIGSCNDYVLRFWEPNAPNFFERVTALFNAKAAGFRTSVSAEPLLDYSPDMLIELIGPFVTGEIWIGTMNHMSQNDFKPEEMLMFKRMTEINSLANIQKVYEQFKDDPRIRWKDSIQDMLGLTEGEE